MSIFEEVNECKVRFRRTGLKFDVIVELTSDIYFPSSVFHMRRDLFLTFIDLILLAATCHQLLNGHKS